MSSLFAALRQLWHLFVDDGSLAGALVVWCGCVGFLLPRLIPFSGWNAPILFLGCIAILLVNIAMAARHHRLRGQENPNA